VIKRLAIALLAAAALVLPSWTQSLHDPNDPIYADIDRWAGLGYIRMLPPVRPYPLQLVDEMLEAVIRKGDGPSRTKAESYRAALARGARPLHVGGTGTLRGEGEDLTLEGAPFIDGSLRLEDWLVFSYSYYMYAATRTPGTQIEIPGVYSPYNDLIVDNARVGPFKIMPDWTSNASFGSAGFYATAGLNRGAFGPFFDNGVVLGPQAARAGHLSWVYRTPSFVLSTLLLGLNATDTLGEGRYPNKHLIVHSIDFSPLRNLEIGFYESVVWGNRFEYLYLLPMSQYFAAQSLVGFEDNSFLGFHAKWKPLPGFSLLADVYADDLSFKDMVRLKLDTKYKFAGQLGLRYTPVSGFLSGVALDYTAVMPYMYTHIATEREDRYGYNGGTPSVNFLNYTHQGVGIGADLAPNSDRVSIRAAFKISPNLSVAALAELTRHGNASEGVAGIVDTDNHDGSINDDGYTDDPTNPKATFQTTTRFLTQDTIETKLRGGLGFSFSIPTSFGLFSAGADYVVEYGWNRNLAPGDNGFAQYYALTGSWRW